MKITPAVRKVLVAIRDRMPTRAGAIITAVNTGLIVWDDNICDRNIMGEYRLTETGKAALEPK